MLTQVKKCGIFINDNLAAPCTLEGRLIYREDNEEYIMSALEEKIKRLKEEKDAVILAHYYVPGEVQAVADYVGDSYYLAKVAKEVPQSTLVFCGVSFMGECAKILNPEKTVLMPDMEADCPMAHMVKDGLVQQMRETYDDLAVVCYVNSTAAVKAQVDVCVTSSNAMKIVKALPNHNIFFIPDCNLGRHIAAHVPEKNFIFNEGHCPIHNVITVEEVMEVKNQHPEAKILIHPECIPEVVALADYAGSTSGIIEYAEKSDAKEFIIVTEEGVMYELGRRCPEKKFYQPKKTPICPGMKLVTLEKVAKVLETYENKVELEESFRARAELPLNKMLELAK